MARLYKCHSSTSIITCVFFIISSLSLIYSSQVVNAKEFSEENEKELSNTDITDVFPIYGLTIEPPLNALEEQNATSELVTVTRAQKRQSENAQGFDYNSGNETDIRKRNDTENNEEERPEGASSQRLLDDTVSTASPLKDIPEDSGVNDSRNPAEDAAPLYKAVGNILEHITGVDHTINDPEEMRMRAYVGERQSYGVEVILQEEIHFWESSLEGDAVNLTETEEEDHNTPLNTSSFSLHQEHYVEEETIKEQDTQITVKEGSHLRLVCNVTGVPTYWVEWRRAANMSFSGGAFVVGARTVLLDYVGREDAGIYSCTATTPSGHSHSSALDVRVHYTPIVGVRDRYMDTDNVELGCLVEGRPRPSLAWYMNNTKLSPNLSPRNVEIRSSVLSSRFVLSILTLSNVSTDNFAYYHCRATNPVGVSRAYIMLHDETGVLDQHELVETHLVKYPPSVLENPRLSDFMLGMVPPLYIGLYIIAYLGCYKTSISGTHGRLVVA